MSFKNGPNNAVSLLLVLSGTTLTETSDSWMWLLVEEERVSTRLGCSCDVDVRELWLTRDCPLRCPEMIVKRWFEIPALDQILMAVALTQWFVYILDKCASSLIFFIILARLCIPTERSCLEPNCIFGCAVFLRILEKGSALWIDFLQV